MSEVDKKRPKRQKTGGRAPGVPNKATREFRETITKLLEDNSGNFGIWLTQVAEGTGENKPDPGKALDLVAKLAEYAAPKLNRTEMTGPNGGAIQAVTKIVLADMDDGSDD